MLSFLVIFPVVAGCATALKRDGRCLASLTPDYLAAQDELQQLQDSWRALLRQEAVVAADKAAVSPAAQREAADAHARLREARRRHQPTLDWYGKVYRRLQMRIEEDRLLTDVQTVLFPTPGILFYPVIRWNIHSVMWDGENPDADSDPVTRFCTDRLATEK
jgi:hypothetical protein